MSFHAPLENVDEQSSSISANTNLIVPHLEFSSTAIQSYVASISFAYAEQIGWSASSPFLQLIMSDPKSNHYSTVYVKANVQEMIHNCVVSIHSSLKEKLQNLTLVKIIKYVLTPRRFLPLFLFDLLDEKSYTDNELRYIANELFTRYDCLFTPDLSFCLRDGTSIKQVNFSPGLINVNSRVMIRNKSDTQHVCPVFLRTLFPTFFVEESPVNKSETNE